MARYGCDDIKGKNPHILRLRQKIRRYAATDTAVFITGESGTGKELVAHALHAESPRHSHPFVAINCAALPEPLLESELFGYEGGAFTGARKEGKPGLFELADRGTLFLDEIGEMSHAVQLRLLRVLEAKEVMRIGGDRLVRVDVRVLSASHKSLKELVQTDKFRMNLYYRLVGFTIQIPPLRQHTEDIPLLLDKLFRAHGHKPSVLTPAMLQRLRQSAWPGNVRELLSFVGGYLSLLEGTRADPALFEELLAEYEQLEPAAGMHTASDALGSGTMKHRLRQFRQCVLRNVLRECGGDKAQAARSLAISASTLHRILEDGE
ncbi:MAG TPA: sigma 54-interacting transcriptional regulator [Candidatus Avidesulfovibrio excrementigallinarum]|nr:sigma 54-interacting transcriptional regulator [Candidatus Avidesulfovibrio excrementigallinarum]